MWRKNFNSSIIDALAYYNKSIDLRVLVHVLLRWEKASDAFLQEILIKENVHLKCPFHDDEKPSFVVDNKYFNCFGCKLKGDYVVFIKKFLEKRYAEIVPGFKPVLDHLDLVTILDDRFLLRSKYVVQKNDFGITPSEYINIFKKYSNCYSRYIRKFYDYFTKNDNISKFLIDRGFTTDFLHKMGVGFCPKMHNIADEVECSERFLELSCILNLRNSHRKDSMFERLIFPIHDYNGQVVGLVGRDCRSHINNAKFLAPKYKCTSPPPFNKPLFYSCMHFFHYSHSLLKHHNLDYICITEGPLDCLRLILHEHPAVSILGSIVTEGRIKALSTLPVKRFICCFDNDNAGEEALKSFISYAPILKRSIQRLEIDVQCKDVDEHLKLFPNSFVVSDVLM